MSLIDREGIFRTAPHAECFYDEAESGAIAAGFKFDITHELRDREWVNVEAEKLTAYARVWIVKTSGELNPKAIEQLVASVKWDGNIETFETLDTPAAQITVGREEYKGKPQFKVQWINPLEDVGAGPKKAGSDLIERLTAKHGSAIRALVGSVPKSPQREKPAEQKRWTRETVWEKFCQVGAEAGLDDAQIASAYMAAIDEYANGGQGTITDEQWEAVVTEGVKQILPF